MAGQVTRRQMETWLLDHGFRRLKGGMSGHVHYEGRGVKITLPGPFTMTQQAQDDYYGDEEALALAFAAAVNEEIRDLRAAGADVIQLDEPWLQARADRAARYGVKAINRALQGVEGTTVVHLCFGYAAAVKDKALMDQIIKASQDLVAMEVTLDGRTITGFKVLKAD